MSDYIKRSDVIDVLKETSIIQDNDLGHLVVEEINRIPTLDEKEMIRKAFERVVERLEEEAKENDYTAWQFDDDGTEYIKEKYEEIASAYREAIEIVKEECGINE